MKLLIVTQRVDSEDPVLGFFHRWIEEFAKQCEKVTVICLFKGAYDFPKNVEVLTLGKESGASRFKYLSCFYHFIWIKRNDYDTVFVHMNQIYVLLGGLLWRCWGKKVGLWYVHRQKSLSVWLAEKMTNVVFTSSKESFRIKSAKVFYLGHGIDTDKFPVIPYIPHDYKLITYIGRITPIKDLKTYIKAAGILEARVPSTYRFQIVGDTDTETDKKYEKELKEMVRAGNLEKTVSFSPGVRYEKLREVFADSYATANMSPTGGMDKTVLSSLSAGRPVFASNQAFGEVFREYKDIFLFPQSDAEVLAQNIQDFSDVKNKERILQELSQKIRNEYDIRTLIRRIIETLSA